MSKNIFATITHVAEKITEAITGHKNDEQAHPNLSEQINVLSGQQNIRHYYSLSQIGLTDAQFAGLTQVQAFDLLVNTMRRYSILQIRCDSSLSNFREAIYQYSSRTSKGKGVIALLEVNVYANERYDARIIGEYTPTFLFECSGYPTTTSDWQQLATTSKTGILSSQMLNGWGIRGKCYIKKTGNIYSLNGQFTWTADSILTNGVELFIIPEQFRPTEDTEINGSISSSFVAERYNVVLKLYKNGSVKLWHDKACTSDKPSYITVCSSY